MNTTVFSQANELLTQLSTWTGLPPLSIGQLTLVIGSALILTLFISGYRKTRKLQQRMERLQHELQIANSSAMGMGQQLLALEKKILRQSQVNNNLHEHQQSLEKQARKLQDSGYQKVSSIASRTAASVAPPSAPMSTSMPKENQHPLPVDDLSLDNMQSYDQAKQWLSQGYDVAYVMKKSGLSQAEVSLMHALQNNADSKTDNIHRL